MNLAEIVSTTHLISAEEFSKEVVLNAGRRKEPLVCPDCRQRAYFINAARDGRAACFGARPHDARCKQKSSPTADGGHANLDETDETVPRANEFVVMPNSREPVPHCIDDPDGEELEGGAGRHVGAPVGRQRTPTLQLSPLLRKLVEDAGFAESSVVLRVGPGQGQSVAASCVRLSELNETHIGQRRFYWGPVSHVNTNSKSAFINNAAYWNVAVEMPIGLFRQMLAEQSLTDAVDSLGANFLARGTVELSRLGALVVQVESLDWFVMRSVSADPTPTLD